MGADTDNQGYQMGWVLVLLGGIVTLIAVGILALYPSCTGMEGSLAAGLGMGLMILGGHEIRRIKLNSDRESRRRRGGVRRG